MPKVPTSWRLVITFATIIGLAASLPPSAARAADHPFQVFFSEQTGYFFFWDPDDWTVVDTSSQPDMDWIRLSNSDIVADLSALVAPGISASECLHRQLDQLASTPSILAVEALSPEGGPPRIPPEDPSFQTDFATTDVVVTVAEAERKAKYAAELTCRDIESGQSLVVSSVVVPAELFNERSWETLRSPVTVSSDQFAGQEANGHSIAVPDELGGVVGTLTTTTTCPFAGVFVLARGVGQEDFVFDPAALTAQDAEQGEVKPVSVFRSLPQGAPDRPAVIHPGEMALFQIVVDSPAFALSYLSPAGQPISLGTFYVGCGGGGGGAPVLIDID